MQKTTEKTPPHLENIASFRDNQVSIHPMAQLLANYSQNLAIYFIRNDR